MRVATPDTRRELTAAIGSGSQRAWAIAHGVKPVDVSDCLCNKPMSAKRENRLRAALGLPLLRWQVVELAENQKVINVNGPESYIARAIRLKPEQAAKLDAFVHNRGYRSYNQYWQSECALDMGID